MKLFSFCFGQPKNLSGLKSKYYLKIRLILITALGEQLWQDTMTKVD